MLPREAPIPWPTLRPYIVRETEPGKAPEIDPKPWLEASQMELARKVMANEVLRHVVEPFDLSGLRFGRLLVLYWHGTKAKKRRWFCQCDCGTKTIVRATSLTCGVTRSCGCLRRETAVRAGLSRRKA